MSVLDELFARLRQQGRKAFIPFVTAGDPNLEYTCRLIRELSSAGCDVIELGFPFSDPIADGPVIQASYTRALDRGVRLEDIFAAVRSLQPDLATPLMGMVSYSLVYRRRPEAFVEEARRSGLSGLIVPDLPAEEAEEFARLASDHDLSPILLVAPTTPPARMERILRLARGFLYCISVTGITGERDQLPDELRDYLAGLRKRTDLPLCVGFGVSKAEHARMLREWADGIIVGSAIVRRLEAAAVDETRAIEEVRQLVRSLMDALNPHGSLTSHPRGG